MGGTGRHTLLTEESKGFLDLSLAADESDDSIVEAVKEISES